MKHVVITGSARGIGYGMAKQFLLRGCKVTINGTTEAGVKSAVQTLQEETNSLQVFGVVGDVSNRKDVQNLWDKAKEHFGEIHIWINNAGIPQPHKLFWDVEKAAIEKSIQVNIIGVMNGSQIAMIEMQKQGHGYIYNMEGFGSDGMTMKMMSLYGTTKRAVHYFTRSLSKEAKNTKVRVGSISPGMVVTDFLTKGLSSNKEERKRTIKMFNILADRVEPVTVFLVEQMLKNESNGARINWLTKPKVAWRFATASFIKRNVIKEE